MDTKDEYIVRHKLLFSSALLVATTFALSGCLQATTNTINQTSTVEAELPVAATVPARGVRPQFAASSPKTAVPPQTILGTLAQQIDAQFLQKAGAVQDLGAARARYEVATFERYPTIIPTASLPVSNESASIGVVAEQTLWDFGATQSRITDADLNIHGKRTELWIARNEVVFDGLNAFLEITRIKQRADVYRDLEKELTTLDALLELRVSGGVADRGEVLRLISAQQEIQRDMIRDQSSLNEAMAKLSSLVPSGGSLPVLTNLRAARDMCAREGLHSNMPEVVLAEITLAKAQNNQRLTQSNRYPRIYAEASLSRTASGSTNRNLGLRLDASNLLGLGRAQELQAVNADVEGARLAYEKTKESVATEFGQYAVEYSGLIASEQTLNALVESKSKTIALYREQIEAGLMDLPDGISFMREHADTILLLHDVEMDIVKNCLSLSLKRGALAQIEPEDG